LGIKGLVVDVVVVGRWSHDKFDTVTKELEAIQGRMEEFSVMNRPETEEELMSLRRRMDELLYREEMMWLQWLRVSWLKEGDRNIKFFHRKAAGRAKKTKINLFRRVDGQITKDKVKMEVMATTFFKELYTTDPAVSH
jgi:hypothetical protein